MTSDSGKDHQRHCPPGLTTAPPCLEGRRGEERGGEGRAHSSMHQGHKHMHERNMLQAHLTFRYVYVAK
jgi:hypothetical protein